MNIAAPRITGRVTATWDLVRLPLLLILLATASPALAAEANLQAPPQSASLDDGHWFLAPKVKRLFRSHTSYEFGDPFGRKNNPLSRLEFPLNSWWGGLDLGVQGPRYRLELEFLAALPEQDDIGLMRDSDWDDNDHSKVRTIYSESATKLKNSFNLDGKLSMSLRQELETPAWLDLRPLVGVRWQRFVLVTHDGMQQNLQGSDPATGLDEWSYTALPGEGIWFRQEYLHAYVGLQVSTDLGRLGLGRPGHGWRVSLQGDIAHVWGENRDRHLLRAGDRVTTERTEGYAWHAGLDLRAPVFSWGALILSADYMFINTKGDHTLTQDGQDLLTFDYGVRAWSQQAGLSLSLEVPF